MLVFEGAKRSEVAGCWGGVHLRVAGVCKAAGCGFVAAQIGVGGRKCFWPLGFPEERVLQPISGEAKVNVPLGRSFNGRTARSQCADGGSIPLLSTSFNPGCRKKLRQPGLVVFAGDCCGKWKGPALVHRPFFHLRLRLGVGLSWRERSLHRGHPCHRRRRQHHLRRHDRRERQRV